jgi:Ca2+-binding RTX toxin-like protein
MFVTGLEYNTTERSKPILISTIAAIVLISVLQFVVQSGWAAVIECPTTILECNGTTADDIIFGNSGTNVIHGLAGNDYIFGSGYSSDYIFGDDGNDVLLGSHGNDVLQGGRGNDKYSGSGGDDTIMEDVGSVGSFNNNNDIISGGEGSDYLSSGFGVDSINGGPGKDYAYPNGYHRDFSFDSVNCGEGTEDFLFLFYSGDGETAINCEILWDEDR